MSDEARRIAIMCAMQAEAAALSEAMLIESQGRDAGMSWWAGELAGRRVVLAQSGMGKVAAAASCQRLIDAWNLSCIVVCGLAGGLDDQLRPGDIIVADALMQHDIDASPIFPRFQLPGLDIDVLHPPADLTDAAKGAARTFLAANPVPASVLKSHGILEPKVRRGLVVTGDQFIESEERLPIREALPGAACVEMEGGAIAQVCYLNETPYCVIRIMSDNADDDAAFDFLRFVREVAPSYVLGIVSRLLPALP